MQENDIIETNNDSNVNNIQDILIEGSLISNEENEEKIIGLRNIQLNCYANSLLQCLYHISPLTEYFISNNLFNLEEKGNEQAFKKNNSIRIKSRKRISLKVEEENNEGILVPDSIEYKENIKESKNFITKLHIMIMKKMKIIIKQFMKLIKIKKKVFIFILIKKTINILFLSTSIKRWVLF